MLCSRAEGGDRDVEGTQSKAPQRSFSSALRGRGSSLTEHTVSLNHSGRCLSARWLKLRYGFPLAC